MKQGNALQVLYDGKIVGTLAMTANHKAAFQYSEEWLEDGFPISPFSLPLKEQVLSRQKITLMDYLAYSQTVYLIIGGDHY